MITFRRSVPLLLTLTALSSFALLNGCDKGAAPPTPAAHDHDHGDAAHADDHDHGDGHDHGTAVDLGTQKSGVYEVRAARDGEVKLGGDAPIDVWATGGSVISVRMWIGSEDAKGSIKAKAEGENDHWHGHVEVPATLPEGSKLWVEVESDKGALTLVSFDLKRG